MPPDFLNNVFHGRKRAADGTDETVPDSSAGVHPSAPQLSRASSPGDVHTDPEDTYAELKEKISSIFRRPAEEICVGSASELILAYSKVIPGRSCRIDMPTVETYAVSAERAGKTVTRNPENWDIRFICNPEHPTGVMRERAEICSIISDAEEKGRQIFVDEGFMDLAGTDESVSDISSENLFVLRSLAGSCAVPTLRSGFGFGSPELIEKMEATCPPRPKDTFTASSAIAAFERYDELRISAKKISGEREWLFDELERRHIPYFASKAPYICLFVGTSAADTARKMRDEGVCVMDCTTAGLPENIRIDVDTREKNKHVLEVLDKCLH